MLNKEEKTETTAELVKRLVESYERRKANGELTKVDVKNVKKTT